MIMLQIHTSDNAVDIDLGELTIESQSPPFPLWRVIWVQDWTEGCVRVQPNVTAKMNVDQGKSFFFRKILYKLDS